MELVGDDCHSSTGRWRQENVGLKTSLGYILTSRLAWATREPVLEEEEKYEEEPLLKAVGQSKDCFG